MSDIAEEITKQIYKAYGSDYGVLFGIPANLKSSVKTVVKLVLQNQMVYIHNLCPDCNGAGSDPITQTRCHACKGEGEIFEKIL